MSGDQKLVPLHRGLEAVRETPRGTAKMMARAEWCARLERVADERGLSVSGALRELRAVAGADMPPDNTLRRWLAAWRAAGAAGLADGRRGRERQVYGWEARALEMHNRPTRPARATVAWWLRQEGFASATASRVRRFLAALPETVGGENTPARAGAHHHRQNFRPFVVRDTGGVDAGLIYQGDGHTCDVYVQHPVTGNHYRPELTVWIDVRTNFCAGFYLHDVESAVGTLYSLSAALLQHDHVPAALHVDPGSGFRNRFLINETSGWLSRLGIDLILALPGNAKGKGLVERWFGIFEERCGKHFESYCGHCRTDDELRYMERAIKAGRLTLPSLRAYAGAVKTYVDAYNATPQRRLGAAPAQLWERLLDRNRVVLPKAALLRPAEKRAVRKATITLFGRRYRAPALNMVNNRAVLVEYDLLDDSRIWVTLNGKLVCEAHLSDARPWLPKSRVEDLKAKQLVGKKKRLQRQLAETEARARPVIDSQADAAAALEMLPEPDERPDEIDPFSCLPD